jgi:hypothetical protein
MWVEFLRSLPGVELELYPPASTAEIAELEQALGHPLASDLKDLLLETNGVSNVTASLKVVWNIQRIRESNLFFRTDEAMRDLYTSLDSLLLFNDAGTDGVHFAFRVTQSRLVPDNSVFVWDPATDSRPFKCWTLKDYLEQWTGGTLDID